jgi:signal transduction histidine kinase/DNA-binding response OmpR family regulator
MGHNHGLTYWNPETGKIVNINHNDGLPSDFVKAVIEDDNRQMWVGTVNGIARINLSQSPFSVVSYKKDDGLISNDINDRAMYKSRNGNLLVGTPGGFMVIVPQEIIKKEYDAKISLTNILSPFNDLSISDITDNKSPEYATQLTLNEGRSFVQLLFSTLDFVESDKIKYAYRIEGLNSDWVDMSNYQVDLSTLSAGDYELQIKARNAEGVWSTHTKSLAIAILPPWYKTHLAYGIYIALVVFLIWNMISYFRLRRRRAAQIREIEQENERQKKLTDMKMQFFANVSHEFRTPLSLIINPLEEFVSKYPQGKNSLIHIVLNNAKYLLELINQLLDFRKLDAKGEVINYMHGDIVSIVKDQFLAFENMAKKKSIDYQFVCNSEIFMDFDYDKVRKITTNILSNAFKYTHDGGSITVSVDKSEDHVMLQFSDTGSGIAPDQQEKIFQCFYRPDLKDFSKEGTGIGLYLVSEYVKLHKGKIKVESNHPRGSIFTVILPLNAAISIQTKLAHEGEHDIQTENAHDQYNPHYVILIVDDNQDFIDFLSASLSTHYKVLKAMNGLEALEILNAENIDIVISDVMMPKMDGLELCNVIKSNILYSHIPVILLTAKASEEYQMEGLNTGADEYIVKPFNMEILKLRINKLIKNNIERQRLFDQQVNIEPNKITITSLDTLFIEKAIHIVEENFGNVNFSVDELAENLSISRGYLYKKLTKITGKTPIEFIRIMRIKRAQQLLQESQMSISEIAYMLGYNSPKIFTKHFKEGYKMTPSEYINQLKHQK